MISWRISALALILLRLHDKFQINRLYSTEIISPSRPYCFLENSFTAHAHVTFSAHADIIHAISITWTFCGFLPGLKILARFQKPGWKIFYLGIYLHLELPSDQENKNGFVDERLWFLGHRAESRSTPGDTLKNFDRETVHDPWV